MSDPIIDAAAENAAVETPQPQSQGPDYGSLVSRYRETGLDLEHEDPGTLARAKALHSRVGDRQVYTEDDLPRIVQERLVNAARTPQGKAYLAQLIGAKLEEAREAAEDGNGEVQPAMLKALQKMIQPFAQKFGMYDQALENYQQGQVYAQAETQAKAVADEADRQFSSAIKAIPGANEHRFMERDFWRDISAGYVKPSQINAQGIRAWVKSYVDERGGSGKARPSTRTKTRGGQLVQAPEDELDINDVSSALREMLPD